MFSSTSDSTSIKFVCGLNEIIKNEIIRSKLKNTVTVLATATQKRYF